MSGTFVLVDFSIDVLSCLLFRAVYKKPYRRCLSGHGGGCGVSYSMCILFLEEDKNIFDNVNFYSSAL